MALHPVALGFPVVRLAAVGALLSLAACASTRPEPPSWQLTTGAASSHAALAVAVRADEETAGANLQGVLVVNPDLIARCPELRRRPASEGGEGEQAWRSVMRALGGCMTHGALVGRSIVMRGPPRPQVVVQYMFAQLGVPERRVLLSATDGSSCVADDDCTPDEKRVELRLADAKATR